MTSPQEDQFSGKLENAFPFNDPVQCSALINEAAGISPLSCFEVMHKITEITDHERRNIPDQQLLSMISELKRKFEHPLKEIVVKAANAVITQQEISADETMKALHEVRKYDNFYPALWIIVAPCYEDSIEELQDTILDEWNLKA